MALQNDRTTDWINVSDLRGTASPVVVDYNVPNLPFNYPVNPNAIIIARDLHGSALDSFVDKVLAAPPKER